MEFRLMDSLVDLGMEQIVVAKVEQVDVSAPLTPELAAFIKESEALANHYDREAIRQNHIIKGYREKMQAIGKSVKKNPPTAEALIKNIQRRGRLPKINPIVDLYNAEALHSFLAIGAHDYQKIKDYVEFTRAEEPDVFVPIGSAEKVVEVGDIVYRDSEKVLAYLDSRDSEFCKITADTTELLLVMQGNARTSVPERIASMERICQRLVTLCQVNYQIAVVEQGNNVFFEK